MPEEEVADLPLFEDGEPTFQIVIGKSEPNTVKHAAKSSIQETLKDKYDVDVYLFTEGSDDDANMDIEILIGNVTSRGEKYFFDEHTLGKEGYVIKIVGEKIIMGSQTDSPDSLSGDNPLSWTVIAVDGNRALILSDAILTSIDSGSISQWNKGCAVRNALNNIEGLFTESEIARAIEYSYKINAGGSTVQASDKLFLLSKAELEAYCSKEEIFIKKDTKYNDHQVLGYQMADFDYEYKYSFYVRDTNAAGEWIIADCEAEQFVTKDNKYVGIRPAMFITMDRVSG
jgi:hypothetical protein